MYSVSLPGSTSIDSQFFVDFYVACDEHKALFRRWFALPPSADTAPLSGAAAAESVPATPVPADASHGTGGMDGPVCPAVFVSGVCQNSVVGAAHVAGHAPQDGPLSGGGDCRASVSLRAGHQAVDSHGDGGFTSPSHPDSSGPQSAPARCLGVLEALDNNDRWCLCIVDVHAGMDNAWARGRVIGTDVIQ